MLEYISYNLCCFRSLMYFYAASSSPLHHFFLFNSILCCSLKAELRNTLARMRSGGIEEATEDGPRVVLRDRLESLLKGGCGRSFATQSAAFKHMKHCCPNILDPYAFEEPNPVKAASKDLAFHGDRGLGGVYVEQVIVITLFCST